MDINFIVGSLYDSSSIDYRLNPLLGLTLRWSGVEKDVFELFMLGKFKDL